MQSIVTKTKLPQLSLRSALLLQNGSESLIDCEEQTMITPVAFPFCILARGELQHGFHVSEQFYSGSELRYLPPKSVVSNFLPVQQIPDIACRQMIEK